MSNSFYSHGSYPATNASGTSAAMRAELDLITAGFDKMPDLSSNSSKAIVVNGGGTALTATVGSLALAGDFSTLGAYSVALTMTASTTLTLPTTGTLATLAGSETLTTKTINLSSNTLTGTIAQFNTACSDADFATLAGSEALTNKTLTAPILSGSVTGTYTLTSPTISSPVFSGSATGTYTLAGTPTITAPTFSGAASGSLSALALTSAVLTTSTVAADPLTALGVASKQYVDAVAFSTGDVKLTLKTTADSTWLLMDDKTIGDASSSASGRANADTEDLFTLIWTNIVDQWAPVSTGRGGSAAADFAAHKTIALPKTLGRALAGYGTGTVVASGTDADVDTGAANSLTVASNNTKWITGMAVVFTLASGTITGLTSSSTYYVIRSSATLVKLATTLADAQAGTERDLTAKSSPVWTITHTYTARVLGEAVGEQSHAMSITELLAHTHSITINAGSPGYDGASSQIINAAGTTGSAGGNVAMNITDPTTYLNVMVKL